MRSLSEKFNELRGQLKSGMGSIRPTGFDPVYYLLFPPQQIIEVKQRLPEWEAQLKVDGFQPQHISMTAVLNDYFRTHDLREPLIAAALLQSNDFSVITRSLTTHLVNDNVVGNAILRAIEAHRHDSTSVLFLSSLDVFLSLPSSCIQARRAALTVGVFSACIRKMAITDRHTLIE